MPNLRKQQREALQTTALDVIKRFKALEQEFGGNTVKYAMRRYLQKTLEETKREKTISRLERELKEIRLRKI